MFVLLPHVIFFPVNDDLREVYLLIQVLSNKAFKGKASLKLEITSSGRKPLVDSLVDEVPLSKDFLFFYSFMTPWDSVRIKGELEMTSFRGSFEVSLGSPDLRTSSLLLAHSVSTSDSGQPIRRGDLYLDACLECAFWNSLYYYLEVESDSPFVVMGTINKGGRVIMRIPPKTFDSSSVIYSHLDLSTLPEGDYTLVLRVVSPSRGSETTLKRDFMKTMYLDEIASFIDYLATPDEVKELKSIPTLRGRIVFLREFWSKFGWDYYLEFRRRVMIADSLFSYSTIKGRYTDRGRIYIKMGPPDEVQRVDIQFGSNPAERWVYYSGYYYVFMDQSGMEDYRLVQTNDPSETVYRQVPTIPERDLDEGSRWDW